jgi:diguanylate cyclase (GGDEF)-like protein
MGWEQARTTWLSGVAGVLVGAAVVLRLLDAHMPADTWRTELWLMGAGVVYGGAAFYAGQTRWGREPGVQLGILGVSTAIAVAVLAVAAPWIDNLAPLASLVAIAFFLNAAALRAPRHLFLAGAIAAAGVSLIWLDMLVMLHRDPFGVLVWVALIVGIAIFSSLAVVTTTERIRRQARRTNAIAIAAQRVGLSTDLGEVAAAVLTACHEVYPDADFGGVLLFDHEAEKLTPLPMSMVAGVVAEAASPTPFDLSPGEGVAGKVFLAAEARCWRTPAEVIAEHGNMREATREQILVLTGGLRSVAAAPLKLPDRGVIGVLTLGSSGREGVWSADDLVVVQGLAEQAALGVERARMYQEQRAQALTDPLTGLANYRQLKNVVVQEMARSRRSDGHLAVVFCDLDGFKRVNDLHGHHAGDGVLRLLARTMSEVLRAEDLAARYGGDEFVCILPGADMAQAVQVTERIGNRFTELLGADDELRHVATFPTCGCALYPEHGDTADAVMAAADAALIKAKHAVAPREPGSR